MLVTSGTGGIIGTLSAGRLVKYIPQYVFMYCALLVATGLALFLIIWERQPSYIAVFIIALGWGYSEGTVDAVIPGNAVNCSYLEHPSNKRQKSKAMLMLLLLM